MNRDERAAQTAAEQAKGREIAARNQLVDKLFRRVPAQHCRAFIKLMVEQAQIDLRLRYLHVHGADEEDIRDVIDVLIEKGRTIEELQTILLLYMEAHPTPTSEVTL
jgi:pyruvate-formate lyase-activating enzyme